VQRTNLIVHQRNQRGNHNGYTVTGLLARNCRDLVTQTFTASSRHENERVAPMNYMLNNGLLRPTVHTVAKNLTKYLLV
jgi:hypothetical protein